MSGLGAIAFKNKSGHAYNFKMYAMDAAFKPGHGGVYVITRRHDEPGHHHGHHIIMIGESDDLSTVSAELPDQDVLAAEEANCFCVHASQDQAARQRIAGELTEKYL